MKALAIDTCTNKISFSAFNGNVNVTVVIQAELKQSERLIPTIQYVLEQACLEPNDLDFMATTIGPGSFTGLRLGLTALKAFNLSTECPLYGVPTLDSYIYQFRDFSGTIIPVIDAKKDRFYFSLYRNGQKIVEDLDISAKEALNYIDIEESVLLIGEDSNLFKEKILEIRPTQNIRTFNGTLNVSENLIFMANEMHKKGEKPLQDYDGPIYLRKSEAEENLNVKA